MSISTTDDVRIERIQQLIAPTILMEQVAITPKASEVVAEARRDSEAILKLSLIHI